ncbi:MAG: DUF3106 domain-containing protein [Rubrivivax sp.]|nr:DUF3106 domain-containing protein [Rubrivivax sp.]
MTKLRLPHVVPGLVLALLIGAAGLTQAEPPSWEALTPAQKQALAPLARDWPSIDPSRKEKWLEVAARFPKMPADERLRLQDRMAAWARLTPAERARARVQFQETRQLPAEEKQARWNAYQALSEDQRQSLVQRARPAARSASGTENGGRANAAIDSGSAKSNLVVPLPAPRARSVAPSLVNARPGATTTTVTTRAKPPPHHQPGLPKIAATQGFVDQTTLLPQRGPQGAAVSAGAAASRPTDRR